jgi:hypothetical protein
MFAFVGLLLLTPLMMWHERSQRFRTLSPVEQNLQRASHGAALIVLVGLFVYFIIGLDAARAWFPQFVRYPNDSWPGLLLVLPVVYGLARFLPGISRSWGQRDALLAMRALVKIAVGVVGGWFLVSEPVARELAQNLWTALLSLALVGVAIWCIITGAVRFVLLTMTGRRQPKMPPAFRDPHGAARDATGQEASAAMRGYGGQRGAAPVSAERTAAYRQRQLRTRWCDRAPGLGTLLPRLEVIAPSGKQPYRIIFIGEKSSLADVLRPIAERVHGELLLPTGETTDTMIAEMAARAAVDGRPAVVLYFSDFDPAGWSRCRCRSAANSRR